MILTSQRKALLLCGFHPFFGSLLTLSVHHMRISRKPKHRHSLAVTGMTSDGHAIRHFLLFICPKWQEKTRCGRVWKNRSLKGTTWRHETTWLESANDIARKRDQKMTWLSLYTALLKPRAFMALPKPQSLLYIVWPTCYLWAESPDWSSHFRCLVAAVSQLNMNLFTYRAISWNPHPDQRPLRIIDIWSLPRCWRVEGCGTGLTQIIQYWAIVNNRVGTHHFTHTSLSVYTHL